MSSRVREELGAPSTSLATQSQNGLKIRAAPRSNMVFRYGSVDGGHSLPAFRELIGSKFRVHDDTHGGLAIKEKEFGDWSETHKVYLDKKLVRSMRSTMGIYTCSIMLVII